MLSRSLAKKTTLPISVPSACRPIQRASSSHAHLTRNAHSKVYRSVKLFNHSQPRQIHLGCERWSFMADKRKFVNSCR